MISRIAALSAVKHYKRSLVVVGAASVACAVMVTIGSLLNGITASFYEAMVPAAGHVRIDDADTPKALSPLSLSLFIRDAEGAIAAIRGLKDPRIASIEPVLSFGALLVEDSAGGDPRNLAMRGMGLAPETRFAGNVRDALIGGSFLPGGEGICLSEAASRLVGAKLGGSVLVLVQDKSGQPWYESLRVTGIFRTESRDFDESTFYMSEAKAATMLDTEGAAREIRLLLAKQDDARPVAAEVAVLLQARGGRALRVLPWQDINASTFALLLFIKILLGVIMGLFAVVAGTIIANTALMSVLERIREFGTMRAIGLKARELRRLVMTEGALLGLAGAVIGLGLGSVVVALLANGGLDLGGAMENLGMRRYNRPKPEAWWYAICAVLSVAVSLAATAQAARTVSSKSVAASLTTD
jgi:putative ABC transport system permease protein